MGAARKSIYSVIEALFVPFEWTGAVPAVQRGCRSVFTQVARRHGHPTGTPRSAFDASAAPVRTRGCKPDILNHVIARPRVSAGYSVWHELPLPRSSFHRSFSHAAPTLARQCLSLASLLPPPILARILSTRPSRALISLIPITYLTTLQSPLSSPPVPASPPNPAPPSPLHTASHSIYLLLRALHLTLIFTPLLLLYPLTLLHHSFQPHWLNLLQSTIRRSGPAFIKWAQWAATRPDLFPQHVCEALEALQTQSPTHPFAVTRVTVEAALQCRLADVFDSFDEQPVASGAIAQVHRARLSADAARLCKLPPGQVVAVKVRHPNVARLLELDFAIMMTAAKAAEHIPVMRDLRLHDSLSQFGAPLHQQLNLQLEAEHLERFNHNFRLWRGVRFPKPVWPLVAQDVLVESFEEGVIVSRYVKSSSRYNERIADVGLRTYLQMLLQDNFVHADLHPGNIMVRVPADVPPRGLLSRALQPVAALLLGGGASERYAPVELSVLDVGMTTSLRGDHQRALLELYKGLASVDGAAIGAAITRLRHQGSTARCDLGAFRRDIEVTFAGLDSAMFREKTQEVVAEVMDCMRRHKLTMDGAACAILITTLVLEGWSTKLDPNIRIMDTIREILPMDWVQRMPGVVDRLVHNHALDLL